MFVSNVMKASGAHRSIRMTYSTIIDVYRLDAARDEETSTRGDNKTYRTLLFVGCGDERRENDGTGKFTRHS